jgi:hypothetical protein
MNPFTVLGLEETADDEAVRAAYLAAVRRSPPDRDPEGFRRIREAYEALRDHERRRWRMLRSCSTPFLQNDAMWGLVSGSVFCGRVVGEHAWLGTSSPDTRVGRCMAQRPG